MMTRAVEAKSIHSATLHRVLPRWMHVYVLPYMLIYPLAMHSAYVAKTIPEDYRFLFFLVVVTVHALTYLACHWSATQAPTIVYQHKKLFYDADRKQFVKVAYPAGLPMKEYKRSSGLRGSMIENELSRYGLNRLDVPVPKFGELFKEHAVAPFFVFQVFCVGLWFMDEYWYYSLFTLLMLFVFESTVVLQRLKNIKELRAMGQAPFDILAYRDGLWKTLKSDQLLPGDLVSVVHQKSEEHTVPCDLLLLQGHCVVNEAMLSGESTPTIKESIQLREDDELMDLKLGENKIHQLFAGTRVLQHEPLAVEVEDPESSSIPPSSDGGCVGYVLRTGFGTTQGKLVRTMMHNTGRVSANNVESLFFILFLLIFAIAAAYHVWTIGLENGRKTSKLLLDCVIILTSVVPPELPMELSLAVNQSLVALSRFAIFCTEPFRIPMAGKVDVCCFDKTGTLTEDKLIVEGVAGFGSKPNELKKASKVDNLTSLAIAACHSLSQTEEGLIGDPMEKAIVEAAHWAVCKGDKVEADSKAHGQKMSLKIIRRFAFSSALKRMSTVSTVELPADFTMRNSPHKNADRPSGACWVATKGAPEVLRTMFKTVPDFYDATYKHFAMNGSRVIALGWKWMTDPKGQHPSHKDHRHWSFEVQREAVECELNFAGFLVFRCPLKPDTAAAIDELHESHHRVVMITGDNPLTACHVARELAILRRPTLILSKVDGDSDDLVWASVDETKRIEMSKDTVEKAIPPAKVVDILSKHDICITGNALDVIGTSPFFISTLLPRLFVYARMSPSQKEFALSSLKKAGYTTLMAGDGTNDVGALKQAHVGVALLDGTPEDLAKIAKIMRERAMLEMKKKQEELMKSWGVQMPQEGQGSGANVAQRKAMDDIMKQMEALEEPPMLKLGDASVAAPFTSKLGTIQSICRILRQGRCTLVTTIQMYKILALNCLITAFCLSALYLDGIKYGDTQATTQGFLIAGCFLFLSWGKPIDRLSRQRPQPNIFNAYILLTVLGQFAVHIAAMWTVVVETKQLMPLDWKPDLDSTKFEPNLLNTTVYLISLAMQVSTFIINYQGRPFRESLQENRPLYFSLTGLYALAVLCAGQVFPELNEYVELVPMDPAFSDFLVKCILADFAGSYLVEYIASALFSDNRPKKSLGLHDQEWERLSLRKGEKRGWIDADGELLLKTPVTQGSIH